METRLHLEMGLQPDETTCGPTCLHAVYQFFGEKKPLDSLISEIETLESGGTLTAMLGCHALRNGYSATIYNYNLSLFDPTWFFLSEQEIVRKLREQKKYKHGAKLRAATKAYTEFVDLGGLLRFDDLSDDLLAEFLVRSVPVVAGLNCTYLYSIARTVPETDEDDDIRGEPTGHFVVLCGYDKKSRHVLVADPYIPNLVDDEHLYEVSIDRLICAILLGVLTYDGTLLIIEPKPEKTGNSQ
jgi:hypothetical protein